MPKTRAILVAAFLPTLLQLVGLAVDGVLWPNNSIMIILIDFVGGVVGMGFGFFALGPRLNWKWSVFAFVYVTMMSVWLLYMSMWIAMRVFGR